MALQDLRVERDVKLMMVFSYSPLQSLAHHWPLHFRCVGSPTARLLRSRCSDARKASDAFGPHQTQERFARACDNAAGSRQLNTVRSSTLSVQKCKALANEGGRVVHSLGGDVCAARLHQPRAEAVSRARSVSVSCLCTARPTFAGNLSWANYSSLSR